MHIQYTTCDILYVQAIASIHVGKALYRYNEVVIACEIVRL